MTQQNKTVTPTKHSGMIYGTWRMLDDKPSAQTINKRLHRCVELGISSVDSAEIYGRYNTEKLLGQAIALSPSLRDQLQIISKAGIYIPCPEQTSVSIAHYNATAARLIESVDRSLQLLGTQALDVFLVHRPDWLSAVDETASGLNKLIRDGKIRSAGVSNYSASQFSALNSRMEQALVSNQVEFSLLQMAPIYDGCFDQCQQLSIQPMAWSPLAGGELVNKNNAAAQRIASAATQMTDRYNGASVAQLAHAWIMAHPAMPRPIIGTNQLSRLTQAAEAAQIRISREDWYHLWSAATGQQLP